MDRLVIDSRFSKDDTTYRGDGYGCGIYCDTTTGDGYGFANTWGDSRGDGRGYKSDLRGDNQLDSDSFPGLTREGSPSDF